MSHDRQIQCYDYVNHPYEMVRDALRADAVPMFGRATQRASARADAIAAQLHVDVGGIEVGTDIEIQVHAIEDTPGAGKIAPGMHLLFEWKARKSSRFFPLMHAELRAFPLTAKETQLAFVGHYDPPLGLFGSAVDAIVGRRIAEASIHRFVTEVADHLRVNLETVSPATAKP